MEIVVVPSLFEKAWDGEGEDVNVFPRVPIEDFLETTYDTDAMALPYLVQGNAVQPRLSTDALAVLEAMGQPPVLAWAFVDYDRDGHEPWPDREDATCALEALLGDLPEDLEGAGGYTTRAGLRLILPLEPPLPVRYARSFLSALHEALPAVPGLALDRSSVEWTRLFRAPKAKRDGKVLEAVAVEPLEAVDPRALMAAWGATLEVDDSASVSTRVGEMPEGPLDLPFETWVAVYAHPYLKVGRAFSAKGGHIYPVVRSALASVAAVGSIEDPQVLLSLVWRSVEATPGLSMFEVWRLCCWVAERQAQANQRADASPDIPPDPPHEVTAEEWETIRPMFRGAQRNLFNRLRDGLPFTAIKARYTESTFLLMRDLVEKAKVPTAEMLYGMLYRSVEAQGFPGPSHQEVWDRAKELIDETRHANDNDARQRVYCSEFPLTIKVVGDGGHLFQLDTRQSPPVYRLTDPVAIYQHFDERTRPGLPFEAEYSSATKLSEILRQYGATVDSAVFVSGQTGTEYDAVRRRLRQGVHALADTPARYHADVDKWLRLLGGTDPEGLLDWCAALTYTADQPIAALYIEGPAGIGKSLFANGCASLWGWSPIDYNKVTGDFNGGLLDCPFLFADEGIKVDRFDVSASEVFRNLVANTSHSINAKFKGLATLFGAVRVLVTANDGEGIPFTKSLGQDGIAAITERILKVRTDDEPRRYLESLGARNGELMDWLKPAGEGGKLVEHLMWLRTNRKLEAKGQRFLVAGKWTDWHAKFSVDQGVKPAVLAVIAGIVRGTAPNALGGPGRRVKVVKVERTVWVHPDTVFDRWLEYADMRRPKASTIYDALEQLAMGAGKKSTRFPGDHVAWCFGIPMESFVLARVCDWDLFGINPEGD